MAAPTTPADLLDLKMMPAWVNEPARTNDYSDYTGEEAESFERRGPRPGRERDSRPRVPKSRAPRERERGPRPERRGTRPAEHHAPREAPPALPSAAVRFLPHSAAFESVIAQIKSSSITYSVFALARMFLDKPERYNVQLTAPAESPLHQLGEAGAVAADRRVLENGAFASARDDFYTIEVTQTEPLKGNFSNVARDRLSGTLLGPTNHHGYQPQLRSLYEQRFSRRMSFSDFQRQIEIVSDPAVVEEWKEQARSVTTYATKGDETPIVFKSAAEAERHFQQTHLPTLLRTVNELTISGVLSRRLPDRALGRVIEDAWSVEIRSPSQMMQELVGGLRAAGLSIFRHRRGMLFVSPVRIRAFGHESAGVSASINAILEKVVETPGINRKQLAEKLVSGIEDVAEVDRIKLLLASDLRWLSSEGYVIEFNDGSLDLPRSKPPAAAQPAAKQPEVEPTAAGTVSSDATDRSYTTHMTSPADEPIGMSADESVEPVEQPNENPSPDAAPVARPG